MWTITVPTSVPVTKTKKFYLNLNVYRNAHHHTLNRAKVLFHEIVAPLIAHLPRIGSVRLTFTLFTGSRQEVDTSNICCIVDKFFSDVLVSCGKLEDDNYNVVLSVDYRYGGYDKGQPRVEVCVDPVSFPPDQPLEEPENVQIIIVQSEIEEAIRSHILGTLNVREGMRIDIDLKATRGDTGYQAIIDIVPETTAARPTQDPAPEPDPIPQTAATTVRATRQPRTPKPEPEVAERQPTEADLAPAGTVQAEAQPAAAVQAEQVGGADNAPPATERKSLFGGLKTPTNS